MPATTLDQATAVAEIIDYVRSYCVMNDEDVQPEEIDLLLRRAGVGEAALVAGWTRWFANVGGGNEPTGDSYT